MSISTNKLPVDISPAKNPVYVELMTDNMYSVAGSNAYISLAFPTVCETVGLGFTLHLGFTSVSFTLAAAPDDSGLQLPVGLSTHTPSVWIALLMLALKKNYYIAKYFNLSEQPLAGNIRFTAKEKLSIYTLSLGANSIPNMSQIDINAGVTPQIRSFFKIFLQILDENDNILGEDMLEPDINQKVLFDISDYFIEELSSDFVFPESSASLIIHKPNICKKYYLKYAEAFDSVIQKLETNNNNNKYYFALNAGLPFYSLAVYNENTTNFLAKLAANKNFLTNQPKEKIIGKDQIEKLYYLSWRYTSGDLRLYVKINYNDGSVHEFLKQTFVLSEMHNVYEVIVSYAQLQIEAIAPTKIIESYEVYLRSRLADDSIPITSETRKYVVDPQTYSEERYFIFQNSLGGFDTLRTTESFQKETNYTRHFSEILNIPAFTVKNPSIKQFSAFEEQTFKTSSGFLSRDSIEWLRDFLLSNKRYEIINGALFPIIITSENVIIREKDSHLYALEFEYKRAYRDVFYAADPSVKKNSITFSDTYL